MVFELIEVLDAENALHDLFFLLRQQHRNFLFRKLLITLVYGCHCNIIVHFAYRVAILKYNH